MNGLLAVALGGALGSVARYGVVLAGLRLFGNGFPVGTMFVNLVGSFLIGAISAFMALKMPDNETLRLLLTTGFLGGFTTFSAFSLDVLSLLQRGQAQTAVFYALASVILSVAAVFAGHGLARAFAA